MTLPAHGAAPVLLSGLREIAPDYRGILCDIWGVLHNGVAAFEDSCEALVRAREEGAAVILVSNAPRPSLSVQAQLDSLDVPRAAYDGLVTSGDVTQERLRAHTGGGVFHLGPKRDRSIFEGVAIDLVGPEAAGIVINTGLFDDRTEKPDDYRPLLGQFAERNVEMICANPDIVVERGNELVWCAGALAELYEAMGSPVVWAGKPHRPIYEQALGLLERVAGAPVPSKQVLAVGDSLRTDLAGAATVGVDALFVAGGIHAHRTGRDDALDPAVLQEMLEEAGMHPRAVIPRLVW